MAVMTYIDIPFLRPEFNGLVDINSLDDLTGKAISVNLADIVLYLFSNSGYHQLFSPKTYYSLYSGYLFYLLKRYCITALAEPPQGRVHFSAHPFLL